MRATVFLGLLLCIAVLLVVNLLLGTVEIPMMEVCRILCGADDNEIFTNIIYQARLPQALTA